ncbi:MAG: hypothetical protein BJBARM5_0979 [Candidatus Parvarchaeum acidophilus ARMAN-5]|uniref:Glycerophosphoryl diester phosphodiesterase membrane domain-containing protein n=1 Tax=Candidatus Parvarchaeum acidophilus ARMAN-5 TaxID=662762 RepID=D6GWV3_PARA5|nr:MAG: hypothetical protein BJBARM5_0979 [Candidatus Parvarchaeum acidophilus ARMAN-5]
MENRFRHIFSPIIYGLKSISEESSFLVFLVIFLVIFVLGFFFIIKTLGLGAFIGESVYSPSALTVILGELSFIISLLVVIFSLCTLFYYKLYFIVSKDIKFSDLIYQSIKKFPKFIIATFVQIIISVIGLIIFIVPGVYYGSSVMFFGFFSIYGNSNIKSTFVKSRIFSKKIRVKSIILFIFYLVLLILFLYILHFIDISLLYKGLLAAILMSYWVVSYSNSIFTLADKEYSSHENQGYSGKLASFYRQN